MDFTQAGKHRSNPDFETLQTHNIWLLVQVLTIIIKIILMRRDLLSFIRELKWNAGIVVGTGRPLGSRQASKVGKLWTKKFHEKKFVVWKKDILSYSKTWFSCYELRQTLIILGHIVILSLDFPIIVNGDLNLPHTNSTRPTHPFTRKYWCSRLLWPSFARVVNDQIETGAGKGFGKERDLIAKENCFMLESFFSAQLRACLCSRFYYPTTIQNTPEISIYVSQDAYGPQN